jgi:hypothetical protein
MPICEATFTTSSPRHPSASGAPAGLAAQRLPSEVSHDQRYDHHPSEEQHGSTLRDVAEHGQLSRDETQRQRRDGGTTAYDSADRPNG